MNGWPKAIDTLNELKRNEFDFSEDKKMDYKNEILRLKEERNAVIVAHLYQDGEIQDIADMVGDSFELSRYCASTDKDTVVFCGCISWLKVPKSFRLKKPFCSLQLMQDVPWQIWQMWKI